MSFKVLEQNKERSETGLAVCRLICSFLSSCIFSEVEQRGYLWANPVQPFLNYCMGKTLGHAVRDAGLRVE